jgi:hypothetical protein
MEGFVAGVKGIRLTAEARNRRMNAGYLLIRVPASGVIGRRDCWTIDEVKKDEVFL